MFDETFPETTGADPLHTSSLLGDQVHPSQSLTIWQYLLQNTRQDPQSLSRSIKHMLHDQDRIHIAPEPELCPSQHWQKLLQGKVMQHSMYCSGVVILSNRHLRFWIEKHLDFLNFYFFILAYCAFPGWNSRLEITFITSLFINCGTHHLPYVHSPDERLPLFVSADADLEKSLISTEAPAVLQTFSFSPSSSSIAQFLFW